MKTFKKYMEMVLEQDGLDFSTVPQTKPAAQRQAAPRQAAAPTISPEALAKEKADLTLILNNGFKSLSDWLKGMFDENVTHWETWKGRLDDDEAKAWTAYFIPQWKAECAEILKELEAKVKTLTDNVADGKKYAADGNMKSLNTKMTGNLKVVQSWPDESTTPVNGTLKYKFLKLDSNDTYRWTINYTSDFKPAPGRQTYEIDTDI